MSESIRKKSKKQTARLAAQGTLAAIAGAVLLSEDAAAQTPGLIDVTSLQGIASAQVQADGSLLVTTNNGQTYTIPDGSFTAQGGQFFVPADFADELSAWASGSGSAGFGGLNAGLAAVGVAIGAAVAVAVATDGDDLDVPVIDVPEPEPEPVDPGAGTDGDDVFISDSSFAIDGGAGNDTVDFSDSTAGVNVDLDLNTPTPGPDSQEGGILDAAPFAGGAVIQELNDIENVIGTDFDDVIFGNNEINILEGGAGDDAFHSFGGADTIDGGEGTDTAIFTALPADVTVDLDDAGNATATGGDTLISIENLTGSNAGNDTLSGNASANVINGNAGDDSLFGEAGNDTLIGGTGDDILAGGGGTDVIDGGEGIDTNSFEGIGLGVTATVAADGTGTAVYGMVNESFTGIENLTGTDNDDVLTATGAAANVIFGGAGDDIIAGGGGTDVLDGGEGNDTNSFVGIGADVTANLAEGTASYGSVNETFTNFENLTGSTGSDNLTGDDADNVLTGAAGNDTLTGGAGDDILAGGGGTDIIDGGAGNDTNSFAGIGLGVTATVAADGTGTATYGQVNESFTGIENLTGTDNNDVLTATGAAANVIFGGAGDDIIAGGGGTDVLDGGAGNDTNSFQGIGVDVVADLAAGTAVYTAPSGVVISETFTNFENLTGFTGNDTLTGDANANILTGGAGNDILDGGDGVDTAVFEDVAANLTVVNNGDGTVTVSSALNGTDTLSNIENLVDSAGVALTVPDFVNVLESGTSDLSGSGAAPTAFTLIDGSNTVSNTVVNAADENLSNAQDVDIFSVTVPTGSTLTSVVLSEFVSTDDVGFIGLTQGGTFPVDNAAGGTDTSSFLGLALFGNGSAGDALTGENILDALASGVSNTDLVAGTDFVGFDASAGFAGGTTLTFLVQQLGNSPIDFTLDFDVGPTSTLSTTSSASPSESVFTSAEDEAPIFADNDSGSVAEDIFVDPADTFEDVIFVADDVFEVA